MYKKSNLGTKGYKHTVDIATIEDNETYLNVKNNVIKTKKAHKKIHGDIAANTPAVAAAPFPPEYFFASSKLNLNLNKATI